MVAYTAGPLVPAALLLLIGRLRCGGRPGRVRTPAVWPSGPPSSPSSGCSAWPCTSR